MKNALTLVSLAALSTLTGCAMAHRDAASRGEGSVRTELVESAWLAGRMDGAGTFDADAYELELDEHSITVHTGRRGGDFAGWAMIRLHTSAEGGFDSDLFAPGATLRSGEDDIDALGCSGPDHYVFDFDGPPIELEVNVEEGPTPGSRLFQFHATYPDGQHTEGGFLYNPR